MEFNQETQVILEKMEAHSRQQLLMTKILCALCVLAVICSLVVMISVSKTATQLAELAQPLHDLMAQTQTVMADLDTTVTDLSAQAETVLNDLGTAASDLSTVDFGSMASQVDDLAKDSQEAISEAMKKMDKIDVNTLNKAVKDLAAIVEPLANLSRRFG